MTVFSAHWQLYSQSIDYCFYSTMTTVFTVHWQLYSKHSDSENCIHSTITTVFKAQWQMSLQHNANCLHRARTTVLTWQSWMSSQGKNNCILRTQTTAHCNVNWLHTLILTVCAGQRQLSVKGIYKGLRLLLAQVKDNFIHSTKYSPCRVHNSLHRVKETPV